MGSITSGFAGAYLEKMYKEVKNGSKLSIWFRNVQLACFLIAVAFCSACNQDIKISGSEPTV